MDLDDDELKATRRMNGSDKNVACMEEDIKILEEFKTKGYSMLLMKYGDRNTTNFKLEQALENLIKAYKELEEKWDKDTHKLQNALDLANADKINNYIPVSLVEERIKEIDKIYKDIPEDEGNFAKAILIKEKQVLQELLEKRK